MSQKINLNSFTENKDKKLQVFIGISQKLQNEIYSSMSIIEIFYTYEMVEHNS